MTKKISIPIDKNIVKVPIEEAMPDNYLPYAVEVAKERALPDVRDGLKPVQRRILYGAYKLNALPNKPYYKSARIVGDILGKYHPHGDTSVYDAMVILAQDFTTKNTLIDGHGNWGSQDGDNAAAMRYTEARLTDIALKMLDDIEKDVVDMQENYSGSEIEPTVLPSKFPNLIVNGSFGIAVGLATNIPPHNLSEVIDATLAYIDNNDLGTKELMKYIKGPDFPTGGIIIGEDSLLSAYETGRGKAVLRAKTSIEQLPNGKLAIVITEFPYRKNKAKILQSVSEISVDKKDSNVLDAIADIRDESDRNGIRGVIELKKSADEKTAEKILKYLFIKTELQCNINFNMVALANGKPETMGLKVMLGHYVNHQKDVIKRRTKRELEIAEKRFHIVEGFIKAMSIMDDIISTIRKSKSKKDAEKNISNLYGFTKVQSEAIVELMLYKLTNLEIKTFQNEHDKLEKEIKKLKKILEDEKELLKVIKKELTQIKDKFGEDRITKIISDETKADIDIEEVIISEDNVITISNDGYIKRISEKSYSRSNNDPKNIDHREGDFNKFLLKSNTKDTIMFFTNQGNMYQLKCIKIPEMKWKERGKKLDIIIDGLDLSKEKIVNVFSISNIKDKMNFLIITSSGNVKKTNLCNFDTNYTKILALRLRKREKLIDIRLVPEDRKEEFISITTLNGLKFSVKEPKIECVDRNIIGTQLFDLPINDEIVSVKYINQYNSKKFIVLNDKDKISVLDNITSKQQMLKHCNTDSYKELLFFTKSGKVYIIKSFMLENVGKSGIKIDKLLHDFDLSNDKIINIISTDNFKEDKSIYFFTKNGLVKRTHLNDFKGNYFQDTSYKFKDKDDYIIEIKDSDNKLDKDIIIITKGGMCIRFDSSSVNYTGKMASGVIGIDLTDKDQVFYSDLVSSNLHSKNEVAIDKENDKNIKIISNKNIKKDIKIEEIKPQNRAGRGKNIISDLKEDHIKSIVIK